MTDQELQARVEAISLKAFHQPFRHHAVFNNRLKTTGGRFHPADMNLDFNPKLFAVYPASVTDGIIKHELVHYHLYDHHRGYQHRDHDFKQLLTAVGGSRFAPPLPVNTISTCMYAPIAVANSFVAGTLMFGGTRVVSVAVNCAYKRRWLVKRFLQNQTYWFKPSFGIDLFGSLIGIQNV